MISHPAADPRLLPHLCPFPPDGVPVKRDGAIQIRHTQVDVPHAHVG